MNQAVLKFYFRVLIAALLAIHIFVSSQTQAAEVKPVNSILETISVPAGPFIMGSLQDEREYAYRLDEIAYGHGNTRKWKWYENETHGTVTARTYAITVNLITNVQYAAFVRETGHRVPDVDRITWVGYGLIHPFERTRRHAWIDNQYPTGREQHPVVMVSYRDAEAFARWWSAKTGQRWRLPTEAEWEKAARGTDGQRFPWGREYDPARLNSHDQGPFDTVPVGQFTDGRSPFGLMDGAGQVFEWTATPAGEGRSFVKGGSWDDKGCGICRPAARHSRPHHLKHILVGFRLVRALNQ